MFSKTILRIVSAVTIFSLAGVMPVLGADAVLEMAPADAIFCARVNNLNQTLGSVDQFLMGVVPIMTSGMLKGQIGMMFGNFELQGFDCNGSFAVFGTAESGNEPPNVFILLPVTNYKDLLDPNFRVSQPDTNGISAVGTGPSGQFFIKQIKSYALMSKEYPKLKAMAGLMSGEKAAGLMTSLDAAQVKQATTEPIWAYVNMVKISSVYKTEIANGLEEMKKHMAEATKTQKSPVFMSGFMNMFEGCVKDFTQQSRSITVTCNPKASVLNLRFALDALPGTEMAGMLVAGGPAKKNPLIGYTEDGAAMNMTGQMDHQLAKKINAKAINLVTLMAGKDANDPNIVKTRKLCDDYIDSIGEFIVCSFKIDPNAKPFFNAKYVLEVKDVNRFNQINDEFVKLWAGSTFNDLYKSMGMETSFIIKRGAENYKGVSIDAATLTMKSTDANAPEAKMMEKMYGNGFEYRWAVVNNLWVCAITSDINDLYKLIDQAKAGAPSQVCSEMQKAMSMIPDAGSEDAIVTYNYLRLMKMMSAFAPMPFTMPDITSRSNLVFGAKVSNGSLAVDAALPKEHLQEMMMAFQMMMQQQMQQQNQQSPGSTPKNN